VTRAAARSLLALLPALAVLLAGCGTPSVAAGTVAKAAQDALERTLGTRPDISCPHDLAGKVGATTRCTLTAEGLDGTYGVTVTVRSIEHGKAHFDVKVDDQPQS
jgi:hypothetical protein